jgi:cell division protein FtsB
MSYCDHDEARLVYALQYAADHDICPVCLEEKYKELEAKNKELEAENEQLKDRLAKVRHQYDELVIKQALKGE